MKQKINTDGISMQGNREGILIYGDPGIGKTTLIGDMALWVWKNFKKKTRLYRTSGGGAGPVRPLIKLGIIEEINLTNYPFAYEGTELAAMGYWWDGSSLVPPSEQPDWDDVL